MKKSFIYSSLLVILFLLIIDIALIGWNRGYDKGYKSGYTQAILDGKIEIECHFKCRPGRVRDTQ